MRKIHLLPVVLLSTTVLLSGQRAKTTNTIVVLNAEQASDLIIKRLVSDKVYPSVPKKCMFAELSESNVGYFSFTIRYNPECCGVQTVSSLLDRFAVIRHSQEIVWFDMADPEQFKPYSLFLKTIKRSR
jgi:hypothetical protein